MEELIEKLAMEMQKRSRVVASGTRTEEGLKAPTN
jgi:hypothetical protein